MNRKLIIFTGCCILSIYMTSVGARSLGDISSTLTFGADIVAKLMWAACIITGIVLIAASFTQFQIHRYNPKLVPLTTPVLYLILGVVAIGIPFASRIFDAQDSYMGSQETPSSGSTSRQ
jgi:hypothetical protein